MSQLNKCQLFLILLLVPLLMVVVFPGQDVTCHQTVLETMKAVSHYSVNN